jgi:hypothetical protein
VGDQGQVDTAFNPCLAQLVGCHSERRKCSRGLRDKEAEALSELGGDQITQRHVIKDGDQLGARVSTTDCVSDVP